MDDGEGGIEGVDADVEAEVEVKFELHDEEAEDVIEGALRLGQREEMRCFLVPGGVGWFLGPEEVVEAAEDEEDENAIEKRDGDPGSPMRMTVPFDAAESGRV